MKLGPTLQLTNFQAWADDEIPIAPGVTVLVGPTGAGKSTILRALRAWAFNDVDWDRMRRRGAKGPIRISTAGLLRERGPKQPNAYTLPDGEVLGQIGKGVPESVQELIGIRELSLETGGKLRLHFAGQFGGATFLVTDDPKTTASVLGRLIGTTVIYQAEREARSQLRAKQADIRGAQEVLDASRESLAQLEWVPGLQTQFIRWQQRQAELDNRAQVVADMKDVLVRAKGAAQARRRARACAGLTVPDVVELRGHDTRVSRMRECLARAKRLRALADLRTPTPLVLDFARLLRMQQILTAVVEGQKELARLKDEAHAATAAKAKADTALAEAWKRTKACPLCQRPTT